MKKFKFRQTNTRRSGKALTGFTLTELLVTLTIFLIITMAIYLSFELSQKAYKESQRAAEMTQNGRVVIERIVREVRQARKIISDLSDEREGSLGEIVFEDGHIEEPYHYIRYFKEENEVKREVVGYYFSEDSGQELQPWDALPPEEQTLEEKILEPPLTVGEWIDKLEFWGPITINIALTLEKQDKIFQLETSVFSRNF